MRSPGEKTLSALLVSKGILIVLFLAATAIPISCSLLVENRAEQCQSDADCSEIAGTRCDLGAHVCVTDTTTTTGTTSTGGTGGGGGTTGGSGGVTTTTTDVPCDAGDCWSCEPTNDKERLNACTDAECLKFDNKARCEHLQPDGSVPPLDASF